MSDYTVTMLSSYKGWIMEGIARESASALQISPKYNYIPISRREYLNPNILLNSYKLNFSDTNLFLHHSSYLRTLKKTSIENGKVHIFITHFDENDPLTAEDWQLLSQVDKFITQNKSTFSHLQSMGIPKDKITIGYGAIDKNLYYPELVISKLKLNQVLIVGDCKPRKRADLLEKLIDAMPNVNFLIHGSNWNHFSDLGIKTRKNLLVLPFNLKNNPKLMRESTILLSLSELEGGPFPVLEALASGTPVVATDTGFCSELLNSKNGVLLSQKPTLNEIIESVKSGMLLKKKIFNKNILEKDLTWINLAKKLYL